MTEATDPTLTIRTAEASDADAIAALFTDEGYPAGPSDIVERLTRFASEHSRVAIAEHEDALLGFIAVHALPRFEHDDRILRVNTVHHTFIDALCDVFWIQPKT